MARPGAVAARSPTEGGQKAPAAGCAAGCPIPSVGPVTIRLIRPRHWAGRIDAATPPDRDRAIDGLRALAIAGVVLGHWLVAVLLLHDDGSLRNASPLRAMPYLAPLTWVFQMLGLFFLVGGYTGALGLARARSRGATARAWLGARLLRLGRPVVAVAAVWGCALPLLAVAGVPEPTLRTGVVLVVQPLWFIGVYLVCTALTPLVLALDRRLGTAAVLVPLIVVAAVDMLRYGPWAADMPGWIGLINIVPGWWFAYQLGAAWARGRVGRRLAWALMAGGVALFTLLIVRLGYPASLVGVPGVARSNANPPSLLVIALAAAQCGFAIAAHDRLAAWLRRPVAWAVVAAVNLSAMTIFCWALTVVFAVSLGAYTLAAGPLPGLHDVPSGPVWIATRLAWLPVFGAVLAAIWSVARRFDAPWGPGRGAIRVCALAAACGFVGYASTVM